MSTLQLSRQVQQPSWRQSAKAKNMLPFWGLGLFRRVTVEPVPGFGSQNQFNRRRWPRRSVSTVVGHTATLQCYPVALELRQECGAGSLVISDSYDFLLLALGRLHQRAIKF